MTEDDSSLEPKIYFLPNLMTAGNLACGFFAVLCIFYGILAGTRENGYNVTESARFFKYAIYLIFGSCVFDLLDGRMARLIGKDSPFGREFDSLADVVSFGLAPALLLAKAVLFELPNNLGWGIGLLYLLCGAMRLARFNCIAAIPKELRKDDKGDFIGLPIPMAAGVIVSVVFLVIHHYDRVDSLGLWMWPLACAMVGVSLLMMCTFTYPSFKHVHCKTRTKMSILVIAVMIIYSAVQWPHVVPAFLFGVYLLYGLVRPWVTKRWQQRIENDSFTSPDEN